MKEKQQKLNWGIINIEP